MKARNDRNRVDAIGWVQRVNSRWITHHGLSENAGAYLTYLSQCDPERLARSCHRAHQLVRECEPGEDPKPWFYAALFSLATAAEVRRFLADHWFTRVANPSWAAEERSLSGPEHVGGETRQKMDRIRRALRRVEGEG